MPFSFLAKSCSLILLVVLAPLASAEPQETKTENILLVMIDGLRWQEVFTGADDALVNMDRGGVSDVAAIKSRFGRETPEERREALLPFLWQVVGKKGQIYGNSRKGSIGKVTNDQHFSYPGYSEVLCGYADAWVDSNDKRYNRNVTVLEWLHRKPAFQGRIAAVTSWDVFPFIINTQRSGIPVNAGFAPFNEVSQTDDVQMLNRLIADTHHVGDTARLDAFTFEGARLYLKEKKPRVLFVSFDETDTQGHAGRYDRVLSSANRNDSFVRQLWETVQTMPEYKDKTSLIITTDHGRGEPPVEWKNHSTKIAGSEYIWAAFLGPDTPAAGETQNVEEITQSQIAATLAMLLGYDYRAEVPKAAPAILRVLER